MKTIQSPGAEGSMQSCRSKWNPPSTPPQEEFKELVNQKEEEEKKTTVKIEEAHHIEKMGADFLRNQT